MNTKHIFVSVLDVAENLPFDVKQEKNLAKNFENQEKARKELSKFIDLLQKNLKEDISYLGMDVIGEKSYERFMFKGSGFLEIMVEAPIALTAHFPNKRRAKKFCLALKKTMKKTLPKGPESQMFIDSIEVQDENDTSLTVKEWHKIQNIRA